MNLIKISTYELLADNKFDLKAWILQLENFEKAETVSSFEEPAAATIISYGEVHEVASNLGWLWLSCTAPRLNKFNFKNKKLLFHFYYT